MIRLLKIIRDYTPNYRTLDTPLKISRVVQDLYDQVRNFYNYLSDPDFIKTHKGETGKSAFELWNELPENQDKTIQDFFNEMVTDPKALHGSNKVVVVDENLNAIEDIETNTELSVLYYNNSDTTVTITFTPTETYKTPNNDVLTLSINPNCYSEISFLNIEGITFVRGI